MFKQPRSLQLAIDSPNPLRGLGNTREMDTIKTWLTLREVVEGFISMSSTIGLQRSAILIALIFLIAGCSSAASSLADENDGYQADSFTKTHGEPILVEGLPPLMCCLLYTSPSPRDMTGSRMPSSA